MAYHVRRETLRVKGENLSIRLAADMASHVPTNAVWTRRSNPPRQKQKERHTQKRGANSHRHFNGKEGAVREGVATAK